MISDAVETPWSLTKSQIQILDLLVSYDGCHRLVAEDLKISTRTVEAHCRNIRKLMGLVGRGHMAHVLAWQRYRLKGDCLLPDAKTPERYPERLALSFLSTCWRNGYS